VIALVTDFYRERGVDEGTRFVVITNDPGGDRGAGDSDVTTGGVAGVLGHYRGHRQQGGRGD
jgi:hypothetical protein